MYTYHVYITMCILCILYIYIYYVYYVGLYYYYHVYIMLYRTSYTPKYHTIIRAAFVSLFVPLLLQGPLTDLRQTWWVYVGGPRNCPWGVLFWKAQRVNRSTDQTSLFRSRRHPAKTTPMQKACPAKGVPSKRHTASKGLIPSTGIFTSKYNTPITNMLMESHKW